MSGHYTEEEARTIRAYVRATKERKKFELKTRLQQARQDFATIVTMIEKYHPVRIYQWGSLLEDRHFSEISDIDIALEGITDAALLSGLRADADRLTQIPVDIVAIEHVHPAYADHIRRRGRVVYER